MTRPKSMTPNRSRSRTGATIANSTIDCDRWLAIRSASTLPTSVAADRHVSVGTDVDRVAEQAGQKSRDKAQAQHKDDVDVRALVAVVVGSGGQVQTRRVGVADIEQRLVQVGRINRIYIRRVILAVSVSHRGTCGSACIGEHRSRQA